MTKFEKCIYGGGKACELQGGSGCIIHKSGYIHPFYSADIINHSVDDSGMYLHKAGDNRVFVLEDLENDFQDEELCKAVLDAPIDYEEDLISKPLYYFDLQSRDGLIRLVELLPILSEDIIKEVYEQIFPGYPVDNEETFNDRVKRLELRGYILDTLENNYELESGIERPRKAPLVYESKENKETNQETANEERNNSTNAE